MTATVLTTMASLPPAPAAVGYGQVDLDANKALVGVTPTVLLNLRRLWLLLQPRATEAVHRALLRVSANHGGAKLLEAYKMEALKTAICQNWYGCVQSDFEMPFARRCEKLVEGYGKANLSAKWLVMLHSTLQEELVELLNQALPHPWQMLQRRKAEGDLRKLLQMDFLTQLDVFDRL